MMMIFSNGMGSKEAVIQPETLDEMISPQFGGDRTSGYGIGFGLSEHGGYQKIGHGGAIYGFSTQLYAIPEIKFGVATASSVEFDPVPAITGIFPFDSLTHSSITLSCSE